MRKTATKALSLFLALTMLMSLVCVPAGAKVIQDGTNGKTIYLSTKATLKKGGEEATTVAANSTFVVEVNFANNPTVLEDSIQGFDLFVKYDNTKMTATNVVNGLTVVVANKAYGSDTVKMAWASESGISIVDDDTLENVVQASGTLAYIAFKATTDLTASDLAAFEFPATGTGNEVAGMSDGNSKKFTIVQTPALDVSVKDGVTLYNTSSKQDIKNALTVMYIDASGKQTAVTDFEVDKASLTVGENIITVTANGISEKVTVTAVADTVESIAVTKQPNKRVYTSGDKLDLTGMEITATYESGATEVVTTGYTTDVEVGTVMTVKEYGPSKIITVTYEGKTAQTWALTVNPRLVTIPTVKGTYTYNGNEQELVLNHAENWEKYYTLSGILKGKEAKNYTAYATLIDDDETRWTDGSEDVQTLTWTIAPNEGDLTLTPVSDDSITYNGKEQKPEYTVTSGGKTLTAGTDYTLSYSNNTNAGTATVAATGLDNYAGATGSAEFTIAKAAVALTWSGADTRTYDGKASNVTASVTNKIGNDDVTVTVTGGDAVNAGTYIATATGLAGDKAKNYQLPEEGLTQSYTINRVALTIASVAVEGKTYDGTTDAKVTSVTFSGLQNGEELVSGTDYTVAGVFDEANVGERTVTVTVTMRDTAKAKNYQLEKTTATATTTITPVQTTLELTAKDAVYTGSAYDAKNISKVSNVNDAPVYTYYADSNGAKGAKLDGAPVNAGTYWVEGYIAASGNNSAVTSAAVKFQITKAPLTATAENKSATYGDTAPAYTVRYAGFVNGETESVVTGLTFDCAYTAGSDAGEYAITPKGATAANYAITFVEGKLTVGKRTAALEWSGYAERTYDGKASSVTASVTNKIGNDDVTVTVTGGDAVNAGTYTATVAGLAGAKAKNYQLPETGRSKGYSITKAARTLSGLADLTLAGDTLSAALQPQVNDLDQSARFTYASNNTAAVTVNAQGVVSAVANGTATVTVTAPATTNYEAAEASVTVKAVTQAITAVSAAPDTVSAALQGKTIVLSGYAESITVTPTYYDGVRLKSGSLTVKAGETAGIVLTVGGRDIPWTIDTSAVVVKPANVTVATDDEVAKAPDADETITDEVLNAIAGENTTASGLDQAAAGLIPEAAKNAPEGTAAVELTFVTQILPESYQNGVLVLEIRPVAQYKYLDQQGNAIKTEEKAIANSDIQGLVTLSVQLPAGMPVADLYARHELGGGQYEYLPVTVENGAATWQQSSFSRVSLIADARSATVTFRMPDGSEQTVTYTPENIGQSLPAASRAGYRFDGWKFPGIDGTYKTLTDELLTALNGKILTAEAQFTVMGGGGGGGGFVSAGYAVSIAKTENGTVTASAETAEEGETITLTVKAETGYVLKTLTAAAEGKDLTLTAGKNGTYTFTMPAADVTVTAVFEKIAFADVKSGSYCYDAVQWAVAKGITLGMSDGSFAPNAPCTRGQIVTFLWRAMGCPAPKSTVNPFTDVKSGSYCYEAVLWAVEQGITKGTTATTFSPNAPCTRGQAVTFLCRAVGTEGTGDTGFADVGANSFCAGSVKWAVENGVTKGTTATTFSPNETCTRGQIVTFLYRAMGK